MRDNNANELERFRGLGKYLEYLAARSLVSLLQRVPMCVSYCIGAWLGEVCWRLLKRRRITVEKNLSIVDAWLAADQSRVVDHEAFGLSIEVQGRLVFRRAGVNLFAGFRFARMGIDELERHLEFKDIHHLKNVLRAGQGAIMLLAHMGPWEALAQISPLFRKNGVDVPFGTMYRPLNNFYLERWFLRQRQSTGTQFFSRQSGFHKPVDFVRDGGILGVLSDQKMREGVVVKYFGVDVKTTPIAGLFLRRSGSCAVALAIRTVGLCKWEVCFLPCPELDNTSLKSREDYARECNRIIERVLALSPLDGFWLHSRFK